jgi:hypothetical protein
MLAWVAAVGCGGGGVEQGEPDSAPPAAELVLGGASPDGTGFVPVHDGDDATLIGGAQGGFHVWTGLRVRGASGQLRLERQARRVDDDALVLRASTVVLDVPELGGAWWERPDGTEVNALPSFMCPTPIGIRVRDEPLRIRAQLLSDDQVLLGEDEIVLVPRCPVDDAGEAEFCAAICSG